jgi:hypothetical protein
MKRYFLISPSSGINHIHQFQDCLESLMIKLDYLKVDKRFIINLNIFMDVENIEMYKNLKIEFNQILIEFFSATLPPISYIPQPPLDSLISIEVVLLTDSQEIINIEYKYFLSNNYVKIKYIDREEIITGGLSVDNLSLNQYEQSEYCFNLLKSLLNHEDLKLSDIVRQWNYIGDIVGYNTINNKIRQNYQEFNDLRTKYYNQDNWINGYPAATGIGININCIIISAIAVKPKNNLKIIPIKNPRQLDAHKYTEKVLQGIPIPELKEKTSPKFERGKIIFNENIAEIYVSGTAAILGQESIKEFSIEIQTSVTIENIINLVSKENLMAQNYNQKNINVKFEYFRAYLKNKTDMVKVKEVCESYFGNIPVIYLNADICRDELLVEIEGVATIEN